MSIQIENLLHFDDSPPEVLKPWLNHPTSITDKLRAQSGNAELLLLKQAWSQPSWWDRYTLGIVAMPVIHRDILMYSQKTACWFARTMIPESTFQANRPFFDRLNQESLGVIVFNEPSIERTALFSYAIDKSCLEYQWLPASFADLDKLLWLRFSEFSIAKIAPFYLVEIYLPGLLEVIA